MTRKDLPKASTAKPLPGTVPPVRTRRWLDALVVAVAAVSLTAISIPEPARATDTLRITHGIASGDVTSTSAVIWARANQGARMLVEYSPMTPISLPALRQSGTVVDPASDFTGKVVLEGLKPDTRYVYWVRFIAPGDGREVVSETAQFKTAPADDMARPLTLVWWGDIGGQSYCRDPERGYALFAQMARLAPDLAIANGDSIYADYTCPTVTTLPDHPRNVLSPDPETALHQFISAADPRWKTRSEVLAAFRAKWKYNLEDDAYRRFRAQTPHFYQLDDHEVINDWSPGEENIGIVRGVSDARPMSALIGPGRTSFFDYTPIRPDVQGRIYRNFRFGKLAEIFLLDDRSYRDDNMVPDGAGKVVDVRLPNGERRRLEGKEKTMLGRAQLEWLINGLRDAEARGVLWKIISTDDPLSSVTGSYNLYSPEGSMKPLFTIRDGWAAGVRLTTDRDGNQDNPLGFESELRRIMNAIKAAGVKNVIWLATDVHYARMLRYEPASDLSGLMFHEFIAGPTSAVSLPPSPLSQTFTPIEMFARGRGPDPSRPSFFNFGLIRIAAEGSLTVEIRDADGVVPVDERGRHGTLTLTPKR
jgi:alkaline phosphatase D